MAIAVGRPGAATLTPRTISAAVCALTTLTFLLDAALLAATANVAGPGGWPSSLATPDGDLVPAGRFVHARHWMRGA